MKHLKKTMCMFLSFLLAFSTIQVTLPRAIAVEGQSGERQVLFAQGAAANHVAGGVVLTSNAEDDITVDSWEALQNAINSATEGQTIVLSSDITIGGTLAVVRGGVSFAIDLAGHTVNRNLTSQDEDNNGHVFDVNQGTLTIKDSSAEKSGKITGGYDENGGGVVIGGEGHLIVESGAITGNQAYNGGGIFVYGKLTMTGGSVSGNIGGDCGGIYNHGGIIDLNGVFVTDNSTRGAGGGGINNKGTATVANCTISRNVADQGGGGIYNDGALTLTNCAISDNTSKDNGGGINTHNTLTIDNCTITGNSAAVDGGALYSYGCTTTLTNNTTLNANKAEASGGAIRIYGGTVELNHATLSKNEATWYGGGIYSNNGGTLKLLNSTSITENIGYKGGGGAYVESQTTEVQVGSGVVVKDNKANNIYLTGDRRLTVVEPLAEGTKIGVALENLGGTFTYGFKDTNPSTDPNAVFLAEPGYSVLRDGDGEARVVTSDWIGLQGLIDAAADGSMIVLDRSWQAADENVALNISSGKSITIDLNGYTIDRHRSAYTPDGEVIIVNGELGLVDNSYDKKGVVRGGYGDVGGIRVNGGGSLKLQGGTITGNHAQAGGGGVRVFEGGTLISTGGAISGNISDGDGGGVYCSGTFENAICEISNNAAGSLDGSSSLGSGGGVFIAGAAGVTINSGTISSNKANDKGGGICLNSGTLAINDGGTPVSIDSNSANSDGGGIYVGAGSATINAGEIKSNSTRSSGGGIFLVEGATLNLYDATVTGNYAAYDGGGVYNSKGTFNVKGSPRVTGNVGTIGKNVMLAPDSVITIEEALVTEGDAPARLDVQTQGYGRAITRDFSTKGCSIECFTTNDVDSSHPQLQDDGELHIIAGNVKVEVGSWEELQAALDNPPQPDATSAPLIIGLKNDISADDDDGSLDVDQGKEVTLDLRGYVLNRNLSDSEGGDGHVLEVDDDSKLVIIDSVGTGVITGGYADNGGAIYIHGGSAVEIKGGTIMGNRASSDGGGVYARGTLEMKGGSIVRNEAEDNGGGIYAEEDGSLDLRLANISSNTSGNEGGGLDVRVSSAKLWNCSVRNNTAKDDDGGGINIDKSDLLFQIEQTDVIGNASNQEHRGGGIFLNDGRISVTGGSISNNYASDGGGIYNNECAITLDGATLSDNRTGKYGGAGISNRGSCQLANCTFSGNIAEGEGGGICTDGDDYLTATNCTFSNNESADNSGGAICTHRATTLTNCTFTGNRAHYNGGAVCVHGDATVDGGTISENEATEYGGGIVANEGGTLRLLGKTSELKITKNSAAMSGSGVYVPGNTHYVSLGGKVTVLGNEMDSDFFMAGDKCIDVVDSIDGSQIRTALERGTGQFTINLASHAAGTDPATFFLAPTGMAVIPTSDNEAQLVASDWPLLQKMIDETADGASLALDRDWKAAPQNVALQIAAGKNITIDLAGHTIDRARTEYETGGEVFVVSGSLTIVDTSGGAAGKVCGAYGDGGGLAVQSGGTLNFQSGNISGNKAKTGAGVLVLEGGKFNMTGGTITGNYANVDGGGVYSQGETSIAGGAITGNEASGSAGGMWAAGALFIGGTLKIVDNIGPQSSNLLLTSNTVMNVSQRLEESARVDIVAESPNRALTAKLAESGSVDVVQTVFTYDRATGRFEVRDGELFLVQSQDVVAVGDWQALQNAINDEANRDKVIRLVNDITAGEDDDRLLLDGKSVIVDLNGHKLNRNLSDDDDDGHVFELSGNSTLTIRDTAGAGRITGGYAEHGGAINIHEGSTCNVEGGTFTGNRASEEGGAFFVYGTLNVRGGMITQNSAKSGGGIFVHENGIVNIENIVLVNNQANKWGGGAINNKGNATLTGCVIKDNWADNEGGGIYNGDKQLTLNGCTVTQNSSSGGGGLCCYGTVNINDTTISNNYGDDYGGGLYTRGVVNISGGSITGNTGKTDGGGIYNLGGLLTVTGTEISSNSTEAGGGALNNKGTATLTSCNLNGNHANAEGGCVYAGIDSATTIDGCTLQGNSSGNDGGAIAVYGIMTVTNSTISQNMTDSGGAGLYSSGDTTITGTTMTENKAKGSGGGLLARARTLTIENVAVTKNGSSNLGGGLMVEGGSDAVVIKGAVTIKDNDGSGDVYLSDGKLLTVGGVLENDGGATSMGVRTQNGVGVVFTSGYSDANAGKDPATYFTSNDGYLVYLEGAEASTKKETRDDASFIEPDSQINYKNGQLTGVNWMSGISGERRLNEINIPGTHDSATKAALPNLTTGYLMELAAWIDSPIGAYVTGIVLPPLALISTFAPGLIAETLSDYASTFANCQTRYIDELLEDGIRHLDFRLNTYYVDPGWPPNPKEDNGEDLYLCHGKNEKVGTYYAYDERTSGIDGYDYITFRKALSWIKAFLEEHPTETLTMSVAVESVDDVYDEAMARIRKHLREELATQINPSTGKPYLYMEDGVFGKKYTAYPLLKDCRGQVVLDSNDKDAEIIGGLVKGVGLSRVESPDGNFEETAEPKISHLRQFFADHGYNDLPSTAREAIDYLYVVGLNGTDPSSIPMVTPLQIAEDVLDAMFGENGLVINKAGKYIGRINMDGENAEYSKIVWSSNFFDTLQYCKVTVKSGMADETAQSSYILYDTKIPIPDCIYDNPNSEGKFFQYWEGKYDNSVSGNVYQFYPGEEFYITGDITFTAQWGEQQNTQARVLWRDGENKDGLRPEKLTIKVKGSDQPVDFLPSKNWKVALPGDVKPGDITVDWDKIGGDAEGQYACTVREHESGYGIVIELTHTPQQQVQAKGTVRWVDRDDAAGKRPENVTVHLLADSRVIDSVTTTAEKGWAWDLGERPVFVEGQKVNYSVDEDPVEGYETYTKSSEDEGFEITNVIGGAKESTDLTGLVYWTDNDNAGNTRPRSVTINLLRDGMKVDAREVVPDKDGHWVIDFEVPGTINDASYSITEEPVEGYTATVVPMENTGGMLLVCNVLEGHEHKRKTISADMVKPTCTQVGLHRTIEYCEECGEVFSDEKEDIPAIGHDWDEWQTVTEATETRMGLQTRECKHDKAHTQSRVIPAKNHEHGLTHVAAKAATCTEDGNVEYWACTEGENPCGMRFLDAKGTEWVHEEATVVHVLGHEWSEWAVTQEPTEYYPGIERRVCAHDAAHVEFRMVPKKNHEHGLTRVAAKAATCTEDGNIEYWKCTEGDDPCGMCFRNAAGTDWIHEEGTIAHATGHDWGEWRITKASTESEKGEMTRVCHNDPSHTQTRMLPKVGHVHSLVRHAAKAPTCTEDGSIEYWKCSDEDCGMLFRDAAGSEWIHEEAIVVHALGHEWVEPTYEWGEGDATVTATRACLRDPSHTEQETVTAGAITYLQPTCTAPGKMTIVSQPFGNPAFLPQAKPGPDIPALGHDWGEWRVAKEATESEAGEEVRACRRDPSHTQTRAVPKKDHVHGLTHVAAKPATCTEDGNVEYWACTEGESPCGLRFLDAAGAERVDEGATVVPALGHDWGEWVVTKPATETDEGQETRTCTRCGETETRAIPANIAYRYVGPDEQVWMKGGTAALAFTFKRSLADELTFGLFTGVEVDGKAVPEKDVSGEPNYLVESGSLILRLQPLFLESLAEGDHKVTSLFEDGSASATFVVKVASPGNQKEGTGDGKTGDNVAGTGSSSTSSTGRSVDGSHATQTSTPKTGDTALGIVIATMAIMASLALGALAITRRKRKA